MADEEWIEFSFSLGDEAILVCSLEDAKSYIASEALTPSSQVTAFLAQGPKAMIAEELIQLPFAQRGNNRTRGHKEQSTPTELQSGAKSKDNDSDAWLPVIGFDAAQAQIQALWGTGASPSPAETDNSALSSQARNDISDTPTSSPWNDPSGVEAAQRKGGRKTSNAKKRVRSDDTSLLVTSSSTSRRQRADASETKPNISSHGQFWRNLLLFVAALVAFLSWLEGEEAPADNVNVVVTGTANVRDRPTSVGSQVLLTYQRGQELSGRWVPGQIEPTQQWLEIEIDGQLRYVWSGNLEQRDAHSLPASANAPAATEASPQSLVSQEVWECDFDSTLFTVTLTASSYRFMPYNPDGGQLQGAVRILGEWDRGLKVTNLELVGSGAPEGRWGFVQDEYGGKRRALMAYAVESSGDWSECTPPGQAPQYEFN